MNIYELTDYATFDVKQISLEQALDWCIDKCVFRAAEMLSIFSPFKT